jgi:hypothetical protein
MLEWPPPGVVLIGPPQPLWVLQRDGQVATCEAVADTTGAVLLVLWVDGRQACRAPAARLETAGEWCCWFLAAGWQPVECREQQQ